jgi:hypothetical protein
MKVVIDRRFFESGSELGPHGERVLAFVGRLLADVGRGGAHYERIERAADAHFVSLRVSSDLRAIALESGSELVLLWVGHHDDAYRWAHQHRAVRGEAGGVSIVEIPDAGAPVAQDAAALEPECDPAGTCDLGADAAHADGASGR